MPMTTFFLCQENRLCVNPDLLDEILGHVHTDAFLFECVSIGVKRHRLICVHTSVFMAFWSVSVWTVENTNTVEFPAGAKCKRNTSAHCSLQNGYVKEDSTKCQENISSNRFYLDR